jgi:hypothetical protein
MDRQPRKDIWEDEIKRTKERPEVYNHVTTFEKNKNKAHEFGKPYVTVYDKNPMAGKYQPDQTANFMQSNIKIDKAAKKDIWHESIEKAKSIPEAYNLKDTFEQNKNKASEFGKPFKTTYNNNPSACKYQPDITKNLMNTSSNQKMNKDARPDIWKDEIKRASELPEAGNYERKTTFE